MSDPAFDKNGKRIIADDDYLGKALDALYNNPIAQNIGTALERGTNAATLGLQDVATNLIDPKARELQKSLAEQNQIGNIAGEIGGSMMIPVGGILKGAGKFGDILSGGGGKIALGGGMDAIKAGEGGLLAGLGDYAAGTGKQNLLNALGRGAVGAAEQVVPRTLTGIASGDVKADDALSNMALGTGVGAGAGALLRGVGKIANEMRPSGFATPMGEAAEEATAKMAMENKYGMRRGTIKDYFKAFNQQGFGDIGQAEKVKSSISDALDISNKYRFKNADEAGNFIGKLKDTYDEIFKNASTDDLNLIKYKPKMKKGKPVIDKAGDPIHEIEIPEDLMTPEIQKIYRNHISTDLKGLSAKAIHEQLMDDLNETLKAAKSNPNVDVEGPWQDVFNRLTSEQRFHANLTAPERVRRELAIETLDALRNRGVDLAKKAPAGTFKFPEGINSVDELNKAYKDTALFRKIIKQDAMNGTGMFTGGSDTAIKQGISGATNPAEVLKTGVTGLIGNLLSRTLINPVNKIVGSGASAANKALKGNLPFSTTTGAQALNNLDRTLDGIRNRIANNQSGKLGAMAGKVVGSQTPIGNAPMAQAPMAQEAPAPIAPPPAIAQQGPQVPFNTAIGSGGVSNITDASAGQQSPAVAAGIQQAQQVIAQQQGGPLARMANPAPGPLAQARMNARQQLAPPQAQGAQPQNQFDVSMFASPESVQKYPTLMKAFNLDGTKTKYGEFVDGAVKKLYQNYQLGQQGIPYQEVFKQIVEGTEGLKPSQVADLPGAFKDQKSKEDFQKAYDSLQLIETSIDLKPIISTWSNAIDSTLPLNPQYSVQKRQIARILAMGDSSNLPTANKQDDASKSIDSIMNAWNVDNRQKTMEIRQLLARSIGMNVSELQRLGLDKGTILEGVLGN